MTILNITLVVDDDRFESLASWIRSGVVPVLRQAGLSPRAMKVASRDPEAAPSLALQMEFDSADAADSWISTSLPALMTKYDAAFGPQALSFYTILEDI